MMVDDANSLDAAVASLAAGLPIIFPTDTVYGLGVAVGKAETPAVLYDIKQRDHGKPVAWLVADSDALAVYGASVSSEAFEIARAFWPGALTLIVRAGTRVPHAYRSEQDTIALRVPASDLVRDLIRRVGAPIATTSANISGQDAPRIFSELDGRLLEQVRIILHDEDKRSGVASTIIDCTETHPILVREGDISMVDIRSLLKLTL